MEYELIKDIVLIAGIPLGIYLYHWYMKVRSDGITWDEVVGLFSDSDFWDYVSAVKDYKETDEE